MVNTQLFQTTRGQMIPNTNVLNDAGAPAYAFSDKHALAQYAATGCLNATFYASADTQLEKVLELCAKNDPSFVAKVAVYCRERGFMKDMPALLAATLASRGADEVTPVFKRVINNGKMLRNFVQIMRSGATGRKSLGTRTKRLVQNWLTSASEKELLSAYVGTNPSLADVIKMVHPKPILKPVEYPPETVSVVNGSLHIEVSEAEFKAKYSSITGVQREAFFAWVIGKPYESANLPPITAAFEAYKKDRKNPIPEVPFQMLTALELSDTDWAAIAHNAGWHMIRMNLNTFARHGVFKLEGMTDVIAARLVDPEAIAKARVFPYQLLMAYLATSQSTDIPYKIKEALQDALELSLVNVPEVPGSIAVFPDVSGSMSNAVTGNRGTATTAARCIDIAGLVAAAFMRKNPGRVGVVPFEGDINTSVKLNPRDTVMTNASKLASIRGGSTNCAAPLAFMIANNFTTDLVIYVSDNESWFNSINSRRGTGVMQLWNKFKVNNPKAKLVCIDITPNGTTQASERNDILNIGGFSDDVFKIIAAFAADKLTSEHWVGEIEAIEI